MHADADIQALRDDIDQIDENILELINQRLLLAKQISDIKNRDGIQIEDNRREKDIMNRLLARNNGPLPADGLIKIYTTIIATGRDIQQN